MLGNYFTGDYIRKYTVIFGTLFNEIYLKRDNANKSQRQKIKVPLRYGPKDKTVVRDDMNPELEQPFAMDLPLMSFELQNIYYDSTRKLNTLGTIACGTTKALNPVPWNLEYALYIRVNKETDGLRIIEQILPFFRPQFVVPAKVQEALGFNHPVSIVYNGVMKQDTYDGSLEDRREIVWTLNFTVKGFLFGPVESDSNIIKRVEANMYTALASDEKSHTIVVTGGQTANGEAVSTRPPSVDWEDVNPALPYSFITDID